MASRRQAPIQQRLQEETDNPYLPNGPGVFNMELSPWQHITSIPDHERNAFERDFARAVGIIEEGKRMPCDTLENAAKFVRRFLFANWLTGGLMGGPAGPPYLTVKLWEAVSHVKRLTAMHYAWYDSATMKEISFREHERRMRAGQVDSVQMGAITRDSADPAEFNTMTCDEFVLALCSMYCSQRARYWVNSCNMAAYLYSMRSVMERIRTVLLPQLARCDVGEPVHMDVSQWEAVWITWLVPYWKDSIRMQPMSTSAMQARLTMYEAAKRLLKLEPKRAMSYKVAIEAERELRQIGPEHRAACTLARLGEEQGNDFAVAVGTWVRVFNILRGAQGPRVPACRLGELRELVGKAVAAGKRLKRWRMKPLLKVEIGPD
ncbi:hypothetical protein Agub_g3043, partial [Astrephomene gubernaculifera]